MGKTSDSANGPVTADQRELIEQFVTLYNQIDRLLRAELGADDKQSFISVVREFAQRNRRWRDGELLRAVAEVRNAIVHGTTKEYGYPAIPNPGITAALAACLEGLQNPARVLPSFGKKVETISLTDTLATVLSTISDRDFSQFPVFSESKF